MDLIGDKKDIRDSRIDNILKKYIDKEFTTVTFIGSQNNSSEENDSYKEHAPVKKFRNGNTSGDSFSSKEINFVSDMQRNINIENQMEIKSILEERAPETTQKLYEVDIREIAKKGEQKNKGKQENIEKEKLLKKALRTAAKNINPNESMKCIQVEFDSKNQYEGILKETVQENDIFFKIKAQTLPNLISWNINIQNIENMVMKKYEIIEHNLLLIMDCTEFLEHIKKNTLKGFLQNTFFLTKFKQLTVVVIGIEKLQPHQEMAVTEAQILTKSYFRFLKNSVDLKYVILESTKANAKIPYKMKKEEKYSLIYEYFNDSNKDTIRIDKSGNGLGRLWRQMLTMFPLARLETAEAITSVYPTPSSLFQAYQICDFKAEDLFTDLTIRRVYDPCAFTRRIGPELSRKCFNFFCSTDNKLL